MTCAFSIPNRIEPSATPTRNPPPETPESLSVSPIGSSPLQHFPGPALADRPGLSVSPIGSSPLQLPECYARCWPGCGFQYPQSDRALCNRSWRWAASSADVTFSIPNRIEPSATVGVVYVVVQFQHFQYPQSDRALCNTKDDGNGISRHAPFSIPNRIEPSATLDKALHASRVLGTFSIPNRIEPSATANATAPLNARTFFQYPQSDRALCNRKHYHCRGLRQYLSVSPIGSSPLQPGTWNSHR